jgi:hypothetical protein
MRYRRALRYETLEDRRLLATVTVNTLADTIDLNDGLTSLREAIFATNLVEGPDTVHLSFHIEDGGPVTFQLTHGDLRITDDLVISSRAGFHTIDARGSDPTPDQKNGDGSRVFVIDDGNDNSLINVSFSGLVITGGDVTGDGGAILNRENLWLADTDVTGSSAVTSDVALLSKGGAIAHSLGELRITEGIIADNSGDFGGGIFVESGALVIDRTVIATNSSISGSGIFIAGGEAEITRSSIRGNSAGAFSLGGGIYNAGNLRVESTTISGNAASFGGGIFSRTDAGEATRIVNSTISGNMAVDRGGGVRNAAGLTTIEHSTITGNQAPPGDGGGVASRGYDNTRTEVDHTIIAGNTNSDIDFVTGDIITFASLGYNLIGTGNAVAKFAAPGDQTGIVAPLLGPLVNNGGPRLPEGNTLLTHALFPGSPAINAGDLNAKAGAGGVPLYDQRGESFMRIYGDRLDIGALEQQPNPLVGDYNFNGIVDVADYVLWRYSCKSTTDLRADGNGDGEVNDFDRRVWRANFGKTIGVAALGTGKLEFNAVVRKPPTSLAADGTLSLVAGTNVSNAVRRRAVGSRLLELTAIESDLYRDDSLLIEIALTKMNDDRRAELALPNQSRKHVAERENSSAHAAVLDYVFEVFGE